MEALCWLDAELSLSGTTEVVERILAGVEPKRPAHQVVSALSTLVLLDDEAGLPLLDLLAQTPSLERDVYQDWIASVRAQLTEGDPDRRAVLARQNTSWLSTEGRAFLVARLRKRGASEESLRPILEQRGDRGWPYREDLSDFRP